MSTVHVNPASNNAKPNGNKPATKPAESPAPETHVAQAAPVVAPPVEVQATAPAEPTAPALTPEERKTMGKAAMADLATANKMLADGEALRAAAIQRLGKAIHPDTHFRFEGKIMTIAYRNGAYFLRGKHDPKNVLDF